MVSARHSPRSRRYGLAGRWTGSTSLAPIWNNAGPMLGAWWAASGSRRIKGSEPGQLTSGMAARESEVCLKSAAASGTDHALGVTWTSGNARRTIEVGRTARVGSGLDSSWMQQRSTNGAPIDKTFLPILFRGFFQRRDLVSIEVYTNHRSSGRSSVNGRSPRIGKNDRRTASKYEESTT